MKTRSIILGCATTIIGAFAFMQSCSRPMAPQPACNFVENPQLQRVSWKKNLPVKLYVHQSVPTDAYPAITRAIAEYNAQFRAKFSTQQDVFTVAQWGSPGALDPQKDGYSTIYWFNTWDANKPTEQARTTIYWSGTSVFEADMRIDAANFTFNYGTTSDFVNVDLDSLVLHELGHVLGLAHNPTIGSVMNVTLDNGQVRRDLGTVDMASLGCEY